MPLERMLVNVGTNTVYVWDVQKKRWLLTPDITIPVLVSSPPPDGYAATNIYIDSETGKVVIDYQNS